MTSWRHLLYFPCQWSWSNTEHIVDYFNREKQKQTNLSFCLLMSKTIVKTCFDPDYQKGSILTSKSRWWLTVQDFPHSETTASTTSLKRGMGLQKTWDAVLVCNRVRTLGSSGWPGTYYVYQACLEHRDPPASTSWVLRIKVCTTNWDKLSTNYKLLHIHRKK